MHKIARSLTVWVTVRQVDLHLVLHRAATHRRLIRAFPAPAHPRHGHQALVHVPR